MYPSRVYQYMKVQTPKMYLSHFIHEIKKFKSPKMYPSRVYQYMKVQTPKMYLSHFIHEIKKFKSPKMYPSRVYQYMNVQTPKIYFTCLAGCRGGMYGAARPWHRRAYGGTQPREPCSPGSLAPPRAGKSSWWAWPQSDFGDLHLRARNGLIAYLDINGYAAPGALYQRTGSLLVGPLSLTSTGLQW